jgi:glycosyltransferase involved in cell wall biosynthesis
MLPAFPQPPAPLGRIPRISIIVTNRNYEDFLAQSLLSALQQRGPEVEVIVVDDGSTDSSREVIAAFADRVQPCFQEHQGQTGALNAGFAASTGDVILFLDADDELAPGTAAAVADAFAAHPGAGRVVFRLEVVDRGGRATGALVPPLGVPLADGDVRAAVLAFPDDLAWPPTSGNAFASWLLKRVMPLPMGADATGADHLLHALTPLFAPVVALDRVGGRYRLHDRNSHFRAQFDVARSRRLLLRSTEAHASLERVARELGYGVARPRSVTIAAHRLVSIRIGDGEHPIPHDSRRRALTAGVQAAVGRRDVGIRRRMLYLAWFWTVAFAPRGVVRALAQAAFRPRRTAWLPRLAR